MISSARVLGSSSYLVSVPGNKTSAPSTSHISVVSSCPLASSTLRALCTLLLLIAAAWSAQAQSTFGSIRGTVTDVSGAFVPGAVVTVHSLDESGDRKASTGDNGEFVFANLNAGHYKVSVHRDGFTDVVVPSVALEARQELRVPITLAIASQMTTVEVNAVAGQINTENGTVSATVSNLDLTQLPLNSRAVSSSPLAGLTLSPSVVTDSQGNIAVGGSTAAQTGFSVDGISTANVRANGALKDAYPSQEGISATQVTAFNNNAEFAQMGDVTFTTKSGSNDFHGSAFEYFQDGALDATVYGFSSKAPKRFNTFGGSFSGPVIIPGCGTAKTGKHISLQTTKETARLSQLPCCFLFPLRQKEQVT
jgi:Carboxypeptidase regulatory-like domain